uniref:BTB domain-containing protein n=1 Tax=Glossina brevipalpis TaxID=37001 RepID=A0A1A9X3H3_9MUSC
MFADDMKENREGEAKFPEFKATALKAVINYVYSGMINITEDSVESILLITNMLQIDWVKDQYGQFLQQRVKVTNCFSTRRIADMYSCKQLGNYWSEYILLRCFPRLINVEEFLQLSFDEVCRQAMNSNLTIFMHNPKKTLIEVC